VFFKKFCSHFILGQLYGMGALARQKMRETLSQGVVNMLLGNSQPIETVHTLASLLSPDLIRRAELAIWTHSADSLSIQIPQLYDMETSNNE